MPPTFGRKTRVTLISLERSSGICRQLCSGCGPSATTVEFTVSTTSRPFRRFTRNHAADRS